MITTDYKNRVLQGFIKLPVDNTVELSPKYAHYNNFVEATKIIIGWGQDVDNGFELEFNSNYTKVRKRNTIKYAKDRVHPQP